MNPFEQVVATNCADSDLYDALSFRGALQETANWDDQKYRGLEDAIYNLAGVGFTQDTARHLFRIYSDVMLSLAAHFDPNDVFRVRNKTDDDLHDLRERLTLVFAGYFAGAMPDRSLFGS